MPDFRILLPSLVAMLVGTASVQAAPKPKVELDTAAVRKFYLEGEFDRAIEDIERAMKWDRVFSHEDSVFMFKHLGVMYAAKYETREKGRHYMYQLLTVEPTARILDMYASEMIYMIFKNIQTEFEARERDPAIDDRKSSRDTLAPGPHPASGKNSRAWIAWTASAVAAAGGIALTVHLLEESGGHRKEYIPE